jgi:hypothetical protein
LILSQGCCMTARERFEATGREAILFVVEIGGQKLLGVASVEIDSVPISVKGVQDGGAITQCVRIPVNVAERSRELGKRENPILPAPPVVECTIGSKGSGGAYFIMAGLFAADEKDLRWFDTTLKSASEAEHLGWQRVPGGGYRLTSSRQDLRAEDGDSGVILLPELSHAKYAVFYVVVK